MRSIWRVARWPLLALVLVGLYAGYRLVWGTPFTLRQLADRQAIQLMLPEPELLTAVGAVDGGLLDRHSGRLAPVDVARRDERYARLDAFVAELGDFDRESLPAQDRVTFDVLEDFYSGQLALRRFDY